MDAVDGAGVAMAIRQIQSNFSLGELDQRLIARADFAGYFKGAQKLENIIVIPQGGAKRRFGFKFAFEVTDLISGDRITNPAQVAATLFDFSQAKRFFIVVRPNDIGGANNVAIDIYLDDALQATVVSGLHSVMDIDGLTFLRMQDRVIILSKDIQYSELVRGANDATWTLAAITLSQNPVYDFSIIDGSSYRGATDTFTPSATSGPGITLTAANAVYTAGHVGGLYIGHGGVFRITAINAGGTVATGDTIQDFDSTAAIKGVDSLLYESAWGDFTGGTPAGEDRGWPSRGTFFQERMVLANSDALPNVLAASSKGDFYNFDDAEPLDTSAFSRVIGSDGNEEIQDIIGTKSLLALGYNGIFGTSLFVDQPITPGNAFFVEQAKDGSANLEAQIVDNQVIYIDQNQQQVRLGDYDISSSAYNIIDGTLLSPQAINVPTSTASYSPANNDGSFYMATNTDGTMATYQSLVAQNITAWTPNKTRGRFERVYASRDTAYVLTKRQITTGAVVAGSVDNVYKTNKDFQAFVNITSSAQDPGTDTTVFEFNDTYFLVGNTSPFYIIDVALDTPADVSILPTFEYLNNLGEWVSFAPTDGTAGFTADGEISWDLSTDTPNWFPVDLGNLVTLPPNTVNGIATKFWMRIKRTEETLVTVPIEDQFQFNVTDVLMFESANFDELTDATEITTSDSAGDVINLDHLIGNQVYALVDDIPVGPKFVSATGTINVSRETSNVRVGINYIPSIQPMPLVAEFTFGQNVYQPKHIKSIYVDYYKSLGVTVNGQEIPTLHLDNFVLDQTPIPASGFYEIAPMRGWNPRGINTISQNLPLPMTIIGIGYRLEAS